MKNKKTHWSQDVSCFNPLTATREELLLEIHRWYPRGSGPLSAMRAICISYIAIGKLRGFEFSIEEIDSYNLTWQKALSK